MAKSQRTLATLIWLANCNTPQDVQRFRSKNPHYIPADLAGLVVPGLLRQVWNGGPRASTAATLILCGQGTLRSIINSVQRAIATDAESPLSEEAALLLLPNRVDWASGELVYKWPSGLQKDLYVLLKESHLAKVCTAPKCGAPYFVAAKTTQKYCSTDCSDAIQDELRLRWWRDNGNEWRRKRKRKSEKQGRQS